MTQIPAGCLRMTLTGWSLSAVWRKRLLIQWPRIRLNSMTSLRSAIWWSPISISSILQLPRIGTTMRIVTAFGRSPWWYSWWRTASLYPIMSLWPWTVSTTGATLGRSWRIIWQTVPRSSTQWPNLPRTASRKPPMATPFPMNTVNWTRRPACEPLPSPTPTRQRRSRSLFRRSGMIRMIWMESGQTQLPWSCWLTMKIPELR